MYNDERVLDTSSGDCCLMEYKYLMSLNCILKWLNGTLYVYLQKNTPEYKGLCTYVSLHNDTV